MSLLWAQTGFDASGTQTVPPLECGGIGSRC